MRTVGLLLGAVAAFALGCAIVLTIQELPEITTDRFPGRDIMSNGNQ